MKKEQLLKLRRLDATPKMMKMADRDKPERVMVWKTPEEKYRICLYMRCQQLGSILKIAFFLPHFMRAGARRAAFELFINRETGEFLTYDVQRCAWREAKLDMIQWPSYFYMSGSEKWINPEGNKTIKSYLGVKNGGFRGILDYQLSIREEQLKQRYKRETGPWDMDMEQIPPVPKDWERWVDKVGITQNYMFYEYTRAGTKEGYCTWCEKDVPIHNPKHNKIGRCQKCGHVIKFKAMGKAGTFYTNTEDAYLIQRCEDGFTIRQFRVRRCYKKGEYRNPRKSCFEVRRVIYDKHLRGRAYYWGDYKQHEHCWIASGMNTWYQSPGRVYGKTLPMLAKKELNRTGLPEMARALNKLDPEWYLENFRRNPSLEQLAKAGLTRFAYEVANDYDWRNNHSHEVGELHKRLGINKKQLRRLRSNDGGKLFLSWMKYEQEELRPEISDHVIAWFEQECIKPDELDFIRDRMSELQVFNYMQRQIRETGERSKQLLRTWSDYLAMAKRLKMDTYDAIVYRCKKLRQRHDELVKRLQNKEVAIQAGEIAGKYPKVDDICKSLKEKYEYSNETYLILAPNCIEDILNEGQALHHCAGSSDRYFERIENHEAYVLFLRKAEEPDKPYYTLEIEPGGTIRQKRTMYDRQNADLKDAEKFLKAWQKEISGRMTETDMQLAQESRALRIQNFEELQKSGKVIPAGELGGKLLVDVLRADLLENSVTEQINNENDKEVKSA